MPVLWRSLILCQCQAAYDLITEDVYQQLTGYNVNNFRALTLWRNSLSDSRSSWSRRILSFEQTKKRCYETGREKWLKRWSCLLLGSTYIQGIPDSHLSQGTNFPDWGLWRLSSLFPQIHSLMFPRTPFSVHYLLLSCYPTLLSVWYWQTTKY